MARKLVTVREAAELVDRSENTIRRWLRDGLLKEHKGGKGAADVIHVDAGVVLRVAKGQSPALHAEPLRSGKGTARHELQDVKQDKVKLEVALEQLRNKIAGLEAKNKALEIALARAGGAKLNDSFVGFLEDLRNLLDKQIRN
jgi:DNA-binding transcriptional MerR regulator